MPRAAPGATYALIVLFAINLMNFFDRQIIGGVGEGIRRVSGASATRRSGCSAPSSHSSTPSSAYRSVCWRTESSGGSCSHWACSSGARSRRRGALRGTSAS